MIRITNIVNKLLWTKQQHVQKASLPSSYVNHFILYYSSLDII